MGVGSLSPKDNPKLLLENGDVLAGGTAYVFTPSETQERERERVGYTTKRVT